jgi:hypothetical protein
MTKRKQTIDACRQPVSGSWFYEGFPVITGDSRRRLTEKI